MDTTVIPVMANDCEVDGCIHYEDDEEEDSL